jgi:hypothetical protein
MTETALLEAPQNFHLLGMVAHGYNSSYLGGRLGVLQFEASLGKVRKSPSQSTSQGMVVCACHPSYEGGRGRKIMI